MKRPNEFKTGILVLGGFAIFIFANIVISGISFSQEGYPVFIRFPKVSGINPGSDVRLADGIRIGKVIAIEMKEDEAIVETHIKKDTQLTTGSRGSITSTTFLSELFVSISPGAGLGRPLKGGETIEGNAPMSMVEGISEFGTLMKNLNTLIASDSEESIIGDLSGLVRNLGGRLEAVLYESSANLGGTFNSLNQAANKLNLLLDSLQSDLPPALVSLKQLSQNLAQLSELALSDQGSLKPILASRKFHDDLDLILENLKILSIKLKNDPSIILWRSGTR